MIHAVLPRHFLLQRKRPGQDSAQPMIANLDGLVIVSAIDEHLSFELVERFLALAAGAGLRTLLVFSKADLCPSWTNCNRRPRGASTVTIVFLPAVSTAIPELCSNQECSPAKAGALWGVPARENQR
jgi:putative ribosome biogenesis GTPase RsgA